MRFLLVPALLVLAACGDVGTAERLSSSETLDGIDVPTIGTVGDFPDPAHRHVVNVTADGRVVLDGVTCSDFATLAGELRLRGDQTPGPIIEGTKPHRRWSDAGVVLRIDGGLPWGTVSRMLSACWAASTPRVSVAVRHEVDGVEGALGMSLVRSEPGRFETTPPLHTRVDVEPGSGGLSPAAFQLALTKTPLTPIERTLGRFPEFHIDPRTPARSALKLIDAAIRSGCTQLIPGLVERPGSTVDFRRETSEWRVSSSTSTVRINGAIVDADEGATTPSETKRVHGAVAVKVWVR